MRSYVVLVVALAASFGVAGSATANGLTPAMLMNAGWTCFYDPGAPRIACSDPGHGRPTPNDPDAPPSYNFKIFDLDGAFAGTTHFVRADLYNGQRCPQTGARTSSSPRSATTGASTSTAETAMRAAVGAFQSGRLRTAID
jgi:hypothetical protein